MFQLALPSLLTPQPQLELLLDEAEASASERCVDPASMESSIVFDIASKQLLKLHL